MKKLLNCALGAAIVLGGILATGMGIYQLHLLLGAIDPIGFLVTAAIGLFLVAIGCCYFFWGISILKMLWQGCDS